MSEHGVGALAVRDGDTIVGIVSERDLVLSLAKHGAGTAGEATAVAMQPVLSIDVEDDVMDGMRLMTDRRRRHVLVQERDQVIGLVSIGDLVKAVHEEQVGTISSLHQYITTG
jgi:CBS domain-containing protein